MKSNLPTRESIIESLPKHSIGAEIGVFEGEFSKKIYDINQPAKLYLVDIFQGTMVSGDEDGGNMKTINLNDAYESLRKEYSGKNVVVFKGTSELFYEMIPDNHLDFIYIDGDHTYEGVKFDLSRAIDKVKVNGYICGHDYCDNFVGVVRAVDEFCKQFNLELNLTTTKVCKSYYIQKKL